MQKHLQSETNTQITDLLYTNSSHGWFSGEAGLEVAQDFLHTLTENTVHHVILLTDYSPYEQEWLYTGLDVSILS